MLLRRFQLQSKPIVGECYHLSKYLFAFEGIYKALWKNIVYLYYTFVSLLSLSENMLWLLSLLVYYSGDAHDEVFVNHGSCLV